MRTPGIGTGGCQGISVPLVRSDDGVVWFFSLKKMFVFLYMSTERGGSDRKSKTCFKYFGGGGA